MTERPIDEFLELLPLTTEEARAIKIMLWFGRPATYDEISEQYKKRYNIKIGTKLYHILNNLSKKKFIMKYVKSGKKNFCIHSGNLESSIKKAVQEELSRAQSKYDKIQFMEKPSLTTHAGDQDVNKLFLKVLDKLNEGCEIHTIKDTAHFPIKLGDPMDKKAFLKEEENFGKKLWKNRVSGKSKEYYIIEKSKSEEALMNLSKEFGKDYAKKALKGMIKALDLDNFNMIFAENLAFKFFVIPGYCAINAWFSAPKKYTLDRAIAFWYPDDIKGLDEYFWNEWRMTLKGRSEKQAKEEVKKWAERLLEKI